MPLMRPFASSPFASTILRERYDWEGVGWAGVARRVAREVMGAVDAPRGLVDAVTDVIAEGKFVPGGRNLYAAGREMHQTQNCALYFAEDTREGWGDLLRKVTLALMTGAGVGVVYSRVRPAGGRLSRTGGFASGPLPLMHAVNEVGRAAKQGGNRRAAIWAGLHWWHDDAMEFVKKKDWSPEIRAMKARDHEFPAPLDHTNVSVILDDEFFAAYGDASHRLHGRAREVFWATVEMACRTGDPGFSVDVGENAGESGRNAPVHGDTRVLTARGYQRVADIAESPTTIWTGKRWARNVVFKCTAEGAPCVRVTMSGGREIVCEPSHPFLVEVYEGFGKRRRLAAVERVPAVELAEGDVVAVALPQPEVGAVDRRAYTLGFVYGDGTFTGRDRADLTICAENKKPCAAQFAADLPVSWRADGRGYDRAYFSSDSFWSNRDKTRAPLDGASPTWVASFLAGVFDADGNAEPTQRRIRFSSVHRSFVDDVARGLESLGILAHVSDGGPSGYGGRRAWQLVVAADYVRRFLEAVPTVRVRFDVGDWVPYRRSHVKVVSVEAAPSADVYCTDVGHAEHSFCAEGVLVSNCTEITTRDDSDICNLGSVNMARIESLSDMVATVNLATAFLVANTVYSHVPHEEVRAVRDKNRRLGLGLMGVHEWQVTHGHGYGLGTSSIAGMLRAYARSGEFANAWADGWALSRPVKTRAIAPTGTIGIVAETTTGIEPMFCAAYRRRYYTTGETPQLVAQYVVDPLAKRLVEERGVAPEDLEDAMTLAADPERRVAFQAFAQGYVDHGISSTLNLPAWGSALNNPDTVRPLGEMLLRHLPRLRGITVYPDAARGGQPLERCDYREAATREGEVVLEGFDACAARGGSCGS